MQPGIILVRVPDHRTVLSVLAGTTLVTVSPKTTARSVEKTRAAEAAINTWIGLMDFSVAYNIVAICVLSPSSARKTDPKIMARVFTRSPFL